MFHKANMRIVEMQTARNKLNFFLQNLASYSIFSKPHWKYLHFSIIDPIQ